MGPYCGHFQLHLQSWPTGWIGTCPIQFTIAMNHEDCHSKFLNRSSDAKVITGQSEDLFPLSLCGHKGPPLCVLLNQSHSTICLFGVCAKQQALLPLKSR